MKVRLPLCLRRLLVASFVFSGMVYPAAQAGVMHSAVSVKTYTDFGQNMGRYKTGTTNALLSYLNASGVTINYTDGRAAYTLLYGMPSFEATQDGGPAAAIGYNFIATVSHNGVQNPTFTSRYLGGTSSVHYQGIEYRSSQDATFLLVSNTDYKITRLSKIITDITPATVFHDIASLGNTLKDQMVYRAGGGTMYVADTSGNTTSMMGAYVYITGGIMTINGFSQLTDFTTSKGWKSDAAGYTTSSSWGGLGHQRLAAHDDLRSTGRLGQPELDLQHDDQAVRVFGRHAGHLQQHVILQNLATVDG